MRILLVEDELEMAAWLERALAQSGFLPVHAPDVSGAQELLASQQFDAMVLDLRLPDKHGLVFLRELRAAGNQIPVLLLTAQGTLHDRVRGLNLGADDFVSKPFALEEVEARLMALLRRNRGSQASASLNCGSLEYNPANRAFLLSGVVLHLTPREHAALLALITNVDLPVEKSRLHEQVFEQDSDAGPDAIEVVLHRLRKKLAQTDVRIVTVRGLGYMLEESVPWTEHS